MLKFSSVLADKEKIVKQLRRRNITESYLDKLSELVDTYKKLRQQRGMLKKSRHALDKRVGHRKQAGRSLAHIADKERIAKRQLDTFDKNIKLIENNIQKIVKILPNVPHTSVPDADIDQVVFIRKNTILSPCKKTHGPERNTAEKLMAMWDQHFETNHYQSLTHPLNKPFVWLSSYTDETIDSNQLPLKHHTKNQHQRLLFTLSASQQSYASLETVLSDINSFLDAQNVSYTVHEVAVKNLHKVASKSYKINLVFPKTHREKTFLTLYHSADYLANKLNIRLCNSSGGNNKHPHIIFSDLVKVDFLNEWLQENCQ